MVKVKTNNSQGLVQYAGESGTEFVDGFTSSAHTSVTLGNLTQATGRITAKIDTGVLNGLIIRSEVASPDSGFVATGTISATLLSSGYVRATADDVDMDIYLPTRETMLFVFGGPDKVTVGDCIEWCLANDSTDVLHTLVLAPNTGASGPGNAGKRIAANSATNASSLIGGTSVARFWTVITDVDGSSSTYRIS